ncbi:hypothetical protein ABHF33_07240 [Chitinibacter sp. FCG-7]|uniref:Uncharacterized protein n=1 Tax=Chitinibacter mangrovi TaxID=3153927 RepID=A0AAU7FEI6_9NEIS
MIRLLKIPLISMATKSNSPCAMPLSIKALITSPALEATRLQNKYWESIEAVLAAQPEWAAHGSPQPELIWNAFAQIGLDVEKAKLDMNSPQIAARLAQDAY